MQMLRAPGGMRHRPVGGRTVEIPDALRLEFGRAKGKPVSSKSNISLRPAFLVGEVKSTGENCVKVQCYAMCLGQPLCLLISLTTPRKQSH